MPDVIGVLLAAGAGSRMGKPKALVRHNDGRPWLVTARQALLDGGCADVVTVLGARADEAASLLPGAWTITASNWHSGMGASLATGLCQIRDSGEFRAAMVHLVDLPDIGAGVVARMIGYAAPTALARAVYR